jgi:hypothetical protein
MIRLFAALALLLLAGCADLDTTYGSKNGASVNGLRVFDGLIAARADIRRSAALSPRLESDCDLLIHAAPAEALPDPETMDWLEEWLGDGRRQVVLVLRDGDLGEWLCRRWAAEARAEAAGAVDPARLHALAERLEARATEEADLPAPSATTAWFERVGGRDERPVRILGLGNPPVSVAMAARGGLVADDGESLATLILANGRRQDWAIAIPMGTGRMVVVAHAQPLLDGAMADPAARRLATGLVDEIVGWHDERPTAAWVRRLQVRGDDPDAVNPMAMLFTKAPFAVVTWHLVGLAVLALLALAAHLGRRQAPRRERRASFARHIEALARQLAEGRHAAGAAGAIARARGLPPPPAVADAGEGRAWLAASSTASASPPPEPTP